MRNIKITAALTLTFIVLIKLFLPEPKTNTELIKQFWYAKTYAPNQYDIVVCGDSRVYRGISVDALVSKLDTPLATLNLGYSSAGMSEEYLAFALSKFNPTAKNKVLVIGVTPLSLTSESFKNEDYHAFLNKGTFERFRYGYLSEYLKKFSPYTPTDLMEHKKSNYQEVYWNNGWVESYFIEPDSTNALPFYQQVFSKTKVTATEATAFIRKIHEIREEGILVVAFRPPATAAMVALEDSLSGFDERSIKQKLKEEGVVWLEVDRAAYESYDGSHLHKNSAIKLAERIGIEIRQQLKGK